MHILHYRAGPQALTRLRAGAFRPNDLQALILPATGPRWLLSSGFDRALLEHGWFDQENHHVLLLGASAGAWRALALASRDPAHTYAALLEGYCGKHFTFDDDPRAISRSYAELLSQVFTKADVAHALSHPTLDLAIIAARTRGLDRVAARWMEQLVLGSAALLNFASTRAAQLLFERTVFHARAGLATAHPVAASLRGTRHRLTADNFHAVALASGTVPLYMQPVTNIANATPGAYLDGGLSDYHLNQTLELQNGVALLFLHQAHVIPAWLDQFVPWRKAEPSMFSNVLLAYPSPEFVRTLPGGVVPSRDDFKTFVNDPQARFARWRGAVSLSTALGEAFLEDVESGALGRRVQPM